MDLFEKLNNEWKTIIVITHEKEIADRTKSTIIIRDGNIIK
jgi:putative ABC transport system ATP-binding protein